jgi:hypothetical protein
MHTMTAAELQDLSYDTEAERVLLWREEELERAGYGRGTARQLAESPNVDLHLATELLRRGCPEPTAVDILL